MISFKRVENAKGKEEFREVGTNRYIGPTEFGSGANFSEVKTNNPPGNLTGTLPSTKSVASEFASFRNVLDNVTQKAYENRPSIAQVLSSFNSKIGASGEISNPAIVGNLIEGETERRTQPLENIYRNTMRTITAMEQTKQQQQQFVNEFFSNMASAGLLSEISGDEYNSITQTGQIPMEVLQKISLKVQSMKNQPSITEQLNAANAGFEIEGGNIIKGTRAQRNNNPLNIKYGGATKKWVEQGIATIEQKPAQDGGNFLVFKNVEDGLKAAQDLMFTSGVYKGLNVEQALRKWSGNGYGSNVTSVPNKPIEQLTEEERQQLFKDMAKAEGFYSGGTMDKVDEGSLVTQLGRMVYGSRISDNEREYLTTIIQEYLKSNPNANVADVRQALLPKLLGFDIKEPTEAERFKWTGSDKEGWKLEDTGKGKKEFAEKLIQSIIAGTDEGLARFDMAGLARLINAGNYEGAITMVEDKVLKYAKTVDSEGFFGEAAASTTLKLADNLRTYLNKLTKSPVGVVKGTMQDWMGRFKSGEAAAVKAKITAMVADWRKNYAGVTLTPAELEFLNSIAPNLYDRPDNFMKKLEALEEQVITKYNATRGMAGLPELDKGSVLSKKQRVQVYFGKQTATSGGNSGTTSSGLNYTITK